MYKIKLFASKLWKFKSIILVTLIISSFFGYFISSRINYHTSKCYCDFETSVTIDEQEFVSFDNINQIYVNKKNNYGEIDIYSMIKNKGLTLYKEDNFYRLESYTKYYEQFFSKKSVSVITRAKVFLKDIIETTLEEEVVFKDSKNIISFYKDTTNPLLFSVFTSLICTISAIIIIIIKPVKENINFYDNENIFKTPFSKKYWKGTTKFLSSAKNIATFSMLLALLLLSKMISLPSGFGMLGLSFGYLFIATTSVIYGPLAGTLLCFLSDILGYFLFDKTGTAFFFGYTLQAMLAGFSYGIFLYKTKLTFFRIFLNRLFVNIICNVVIGSICWGIVANYTNEQTIAYALLLSLPKNLVYLIPQSILLYILFKMIIPIIGKYQYVDSKISQNIALI